MVDKIIKWLSTIAKLVDKIKKIIKHCSINIEFIVVE
jgi:hypothetical protein